MPKFPTPIEQNGRLYFVERDLDNYIRELARLPTVADCGDIVRLIPAVDAASRLGICRRSLGRRIVESRQTAEGGDQACA
jgi:hypothetical protein